MNTIYNIYAKVLSLRMQPLLNDVIHKLQIGFMQETLDFLKQVICRILRTVHKKNAQNRSFHKDGCCMRCRGG